MTTQATESTCHECSNGTCLVCQERHYEARKVLLDHAGFSLAKSLVGAASVSTGADVFASTLSTSHEQLTPNGWLI